MLVLSRKVGEMITIGDNIVIKVIKVGSKAIIGIEAPPHIPICRAELRDDHDKNSSDAA